MQPPALSGADDPSVVQDDLMACEGEHVPLYMIKNQVFYNPKIVDMPKFKYEILLGWIFHYYISLCWAVIYYFVFIILEVNMSYFSVLIFGATTTLAPLLIFLPFTGQGILASNTENPIKTSFIFLVRHSLYGLAMFEAFRWFT